MNSVGMCVGCVAVVVEGIEENQRKPIARLIRTQLSPDILKSFLLL
jgi:hypothetical protein